MRAHPIAAFIGLSMLIYHLTAATLYVIGRWRGEIPSDEE